MYSLILGRRFQKWHGMLANTFSNSFSSTLSLRDDQKGKSFTVSYLVDSLGFTRKLAESVSRKVSFEGKENAVSVLNLLSSHGFTNPQICSITKSYPGLLILDAQKSLAPKLKFLQSRGASSIELTEIVSTVPEILGKKGQKTLSVYFDFIKEMIKGDKNLNCGELCPSFPQGKEANKMRNILALKELGVPQELLLDFLISESVPVYGSVRFDGILKKVVELGFNPKNKMFVYALNVFYNIGNKKIEEKVQFYRSLGFTVDDVWDIVRKFPILLELSEMKVTNCIKTFLDLGFSKDESLKMIKRFPASIGYSTELVKKKVEFMLKEMKWPAEDVVAFPTVVGYSLEKRIVPRCNVIKQLMLKGLLGEFPSLAAMLTITNGQFIKRYVAKHDMKLKSELMALFNCGSDTDQENNEQHK